MLRNRALMAVSVAVCAAYTGIGLVGPVRVLYAQSRGASLAIISAMASAYLIGNFAAQYPSGWLADRFGRRRLLVAGLLVQALLSLVYLPITDPGLFVALRVVEGLAAAAVLPSARALVADVVPNEQRGEAYGLFSAFFNAGFLLGPALGGLLAATGYASAFIGAVACRLVAVGIVLAFVPEAAPRPNGVHPDQGRPVGWRELVTLPLVGAYVLAFGDYLFLGFDEVLLPLWMHDHLGASVTVIGLAYVAWAGPSIVLSPVGGRVADRRRRSALILLFGLAQVPFYVVYGLANAAWLIVALFALHAVVYAFIGPAVDAHVAAASPADARARVQSAYSAMGLIGAFAGANILTPLYAVNFRLPLFALGAVYGACVLVGGLMIRSAEARRLVATPTAPAPLAQYDSSAVS
ncbi:MAG TPA: MFS transporter [Ktedonobacterales bacterium]|nr:MFS transporter [Ktedonobacterales bacterium]